MPSVASRWLSAALASWPLNAQGMTIVMVTHESDIAAWARRRIVFRDGHIVEDRAQQPQTDATVSA